MVTSLHFSLLVQAAASLLLFSIHVNTAQTLDRRCGAGCRIRIPEYVVS